MRGDSTDSFFKAIASKSSDIPKNVYLAVFPPSLYLGRALQAVVNHGLEETVSLGVQNVYPKEKGAFTGEISPQMALDCGARYAILGHSERRAIFHESSEFVGEKLAYCLRDAKGLVPVLCVGETLDERDSGREKDVVGSQLKAAVQGLDKDSRFMVAYEPVWAIGTGRAALPEDAEEMCRYIKEWLEDAMGSNRPVLYGGSVKPENSLELFSMAHIDGGLVGGASLDPEKFLAMIPD